MSAVSAVLLEAALANLHLLAAMLVCGCRFECSVPLAHLLYYNGLSLSVDGLCGFE
jgi:hypothetical protein